ncbi:T9SS type A sorting domain-containing protein [uncultured Algibacter sp.]|uniref:T9SS type A sorting domain-containing protein n=1 Tax=uncultured Algibacter sp. TaxID=298659 RepID=UPI00262EB0E2|nr:T9SS type A sorting domain-containing protein [uncultured Algibacter sp.]
MKFFFSIVIVLVHPFIICGQSIFSNDIATNGPNNDNPYVIGQVVDPNLTVSGIGRGPAINGNNANNRYNARDWNLTAFDSGDYFYFTLTPNLGYEIDFASLVFNVERSNTGPVQIAVRSSIDGYASNIGVPTIGGSGVVTQSTIDLSNINYQNISSAVTFRVYAWGGSNTNGTLSINDFIFNGVVNIIQCASTTTWDGTSWSTIPDSSSAAIINGNYNTSINGSFSACSLTINSGTLSIDNGDYVEVQNDLVCSSAIIVRPQGAFVQVNDLATVTATGRITVEKETAPANNWYEYTYWSSPVNGVTISNGLSDGQSDRVFDFNAQNYLDATMETNNDNTAMPGQDGIDDNGDDWRLVNGTTVMIPGVGYASTHNRVIFESSPGSPKQFVYTFNGIFNNGVINTPLYRNDSETNDNNWNFIGNPYPSAIDADSFFLLNSDVDGVIYFWSQNTAPSTSANGNEVLNFSDSDYAMINATGESAGGDGVTPNRFIPSGQGFFVIYDDAATPISTSGNISEGSVTFNNSMRVLGTTNNNQFFKSSKPKRPITAGDLDNKLWINLTSNNGVFNQALIGYVNGATSLDDGAKYDAQKVISANKSAILYSTIKKSDKKYAIQGKSVKDLTRNERINLGFQSAINVPTIYKLSIYKLQGDFLENNTIYLKDNLVNKTHNLSESDYTFTSEVGEFNNRFKIVFKKTGSTNSLVASEKNALNIVELNNNKFLFSATNSLLLNEISIFDFSGNLIYRLKGNSSTETIELSKLNRLFYIAKIKLSNGVIVTKKFIKN